VNTAGCSTRHRDAGTRTERSRLHRVVHRHHGPLDGRARAAGDTERFSRFMRHLPGSRGSRTSKGVTSS
jgi:hypothetical protein